MGLITKRSVYFSDNVVTMQCGSCMKLTSMSRQGTITRKRGVSRQAINEEQSRKHNIGLRSYCSKFRECIGRIILEGWK